MRPPRFTFRVRALAQVQHLAVATDGQEAIPGDGDRSCARLRLVDGQELAVVEDEIGLGPHRGQQGEGTGGAEKVAAAGLVHRGPL